MESDSVEVMFDYHYDTSEGRHITIHKGDIFTLLAKSTEEWWKVRKNDHEKFYVPANYVKQIIKSPPSKVIGANDSISIHTDIPSSLPINMHHRNGSNGSSNGESVDSQSYGSLDSKGESLDREQTQYSDTNGVTNLNSSSLGLKLHPEITVTTPVSR